MNDRGTKFGQHSSFIARLIVIGGFLTSSIASAADDIRVETVLGDLRSPAGIAIRQVPGAEGYGVYVSEVGAGRIVRLSSDKPNASEEAVTGFIASTDEDEFERLPGPHGLLFLDANRLVAAGSEGESRPFVRLYELTDQKKPLTAEQHEQQAAPATGDEKASGNVTSFYSIARTRANDIVPDFLVLSAIAKDRTAITWRLPVRGGTLGDLSLLGKDHPVASSTAIAVEPRGHIVMIRPDDDRPEKSRMQFVHPIDGRTLMTISIDLPAVIGAAYSPRTGNLYAISDTPRDSDRSGVYRIDAAEAGDSSERSATGKLVAKVQNPTALAFGPDGALYVTSLGQSGGNGKVGSLYKISGDL